MSDPMLQEITNSMEALDANIKTAEARLSVMEEAGEDTTRARGLLREAKARRDKWLQSLKGHGYTPESPA